MKEHPIPQDITSYRFHIVGNMTLKQFAEVGVGCVVAIIFYSLGLPSFIKWPLVFISIGMGAGAAFVPIQERPLDHWVITFFKVMYKPTQYFWKRKAVVLSPFLYEPSQNSNQKKPEIDMSPIRKERIREFMTSITPPAADYALDYSEQERIQSILSTFQQVDVVATQTQTRVEKPNLEIRVRKLGKADDGVVAKLRYAPAFTANIPKEEIVQSKNPSRTTEQIAQIVSVPKITSIDIEANKTSQEEQILAEQQAHNKDQIFIKSQARDVIDPNQTINATFNTNLPFPSPPSEPNKLVGMVLTPQNELIPGAIVELTDEKGHVVRAVKTNALGQFFVTTPLKDGNYVVTIEKEGMSFSPQQIVADGKSIDPMEIHSQ